MEIQRINRSDPERIFMTFKNSYSTASFTAGQWAAHDMVTDQDGVSVTKPANANRNFIAGVATGTIAHNAYGLFQVWGHRGAARCQGGDGNTVSKLSAGAPMFFLNSGFAAQRVPSSAAAEAVLRNDYARRVCGWALAPTNTAALTTQENTSGSFAVLITCL